ncbi:class I SAM-dependent methyltransferase [Halalkalicoccus subterraneus]|uniref:class I SAM-dependent methyltransferase n=1 Tax=Halalkalicoccus subterraneus TaxID=2675002 RepID=UPI000EFB6680|nr:class I SAM-dependent methyltransferase [Halalkalicoccus subterraneus]
MDERRDVKEAYDEMAKHYIDVVTSESSSELPKPVKRFQKELGPEDELLDAGCGPGRSTLLMAGENGVGLDISREQLSLASERVTARLVQGDMTSLPFASDSFDAVSAIYSLIHVPVDDHRRALAEFARVLRPGGTLLVTEGGVEWTGSNPDWLDSGVKMRWSMAGPEATRKDLQGCGFEIRDVWDVLDPTTDDGVKPFFLATLP